MNEERPTNPIEQARNLGYMLMFVCRVFAVSVEVVLHRQMGVNAIGGAGVAALLLIPLWGGFFPDRDPSALHIFWGLFLFMCLVRRIEAVRRWRRGEIEHSRYTGWPRFKRLLPSSSELGFKRIVEPILVFLIGVLLLPASEPLGTYLIFAAGGLFVSVNVVEAAEHAQARELNDALINQRQTAERLRRMQNDRW